MMLSYIHCLSICMGIVTIWFLSPAFVSLTQLHNFLFKKEEEGIYTYDDAMLYGANHLGKLATLLTCKICFSFWTAFLFAPIYAIQTDEGLTFAATCVVLSPMFNYLVVTLLQRIEHD